MVGLEPGQGPYRVLVVDDKEENRAVATELLNSVGFLTREAPNGEEAIAAFHSWSPHLILMDVRMPGMSGYEAINRIKATEEGRRTPVIAVTASAFEDERRKALEIGADGYVRKPFKEQQLFDAIESCLGVRYLYEGESPPATPMETPPAAVPPSELPRELVHRMVEATTSLDLDLLLELVDEVEKHSPPLAGRLRELAKGFQFDNVLEVLQKGA